MRKIILVLLIFILTLGNIQFSVFARGDWLTDWEFRKSHIIGYSVGAGTNYQIRIKTHYGFGTDNGENVYLSNSCRVDFGDIRFTDDDGVTELDFWIEEKINGSYTLFWVTIKDSLDKRVKIYVYYGNPDAIYDDTTIKGYKTFPSFFDNFESGNYLNYRRYANNPILSSESGEWDYGFLVKPSVIYRKGKYWMYYYGAVDDPDVIPRKIGLATSTNGYTFTKESTNPIFEPDLGEWDSHSVLDPCILYQNGYFWLYYTGFQYINSTHTLYAIGLAKSTDGINFTRITNGIDGTSKVLEKSTNFSDWDYNLISSCSVLYHDSKFYLYYWARPDATATAHFETGLAISEDGVSFQKITDGIDGTSKVLAVGSPTDWDARHVFRGSVFYYENKFRMFYIGNYPYPDLKKEIGYAESDDGKDWTKSTENPLMQIGTEDWENDYLPAVSFIFQENDLNKKGLLYYQGAYATEPTNRIGLFMQQTKDIWKNKYSWIDVKFTPIKTVVTNPVYKGTYAFNVGSDLFAESEFTASNHSSLVNYAVNFRVRFDETDIDHYFYVGTEYATGKTIRCFRASENGHLQYYNGTHFINFPTDIIYSTLIWRKIEIRFQIEKKEFEVLWDGLSIGKNLWDTGFTESTSINIFVGTGTWGNIFLDEMFIRKYVYPEPTHEAWDIVDESGTWFGIIMFTISVTGLIITPPMSDFLTKYKNDKMEQIFFWVIGWLFFGMLFVVWIYSW